VSFCDRARRKFYLDPAYLAYKLKQSIKDRRELQRNLKGFLTLSKYLIRGSRHDKNVTHGDKPVVTGKAQDATV
jgi:anaerobic magnesium-protoporphyrin IX monomethyl ester cyclase